MNTPMTAEELAALDQRQRNASLWWELSAEEIARAYAAGRRNFNRANLGRANLGRANLGRANLEGANLGRANLGRANLEGANLGRANLGRANLGRANLEGANLGRANLEGANLGRANLEGANLEGANLGRANLGRANLGRANLEGANLVNTPGVYSAYAHFLSSRGASLLGGLDIADGAVVLRFWAGCQEAITADTLRAKVKRSHGDNIHAQHYEAAIAFIEAAFAIDMAAGKWDYLLTWQADNADMLAKFEAMREEMAEGE